MPKVTKNALTDEEANGQWQWLEAELQKPRAPWTICAGHHPVYSNGKHGDTGTLERDLAPLLQKYGVALYLAAMITISSIWSSRTSKPHLSSPAAEAPCARRNRE